MDIIVKRRYTENTDGSRSCLVTYRRPDGSKYTVQAY